MQPSEGRARPLVGGQGAPIRPPTHPRTHRWLTHPQMRRNAGAFWNHQLFYMHILAPYGSQVGGWCAGAGACRAGWCGSAARVGLDCRRRRPKPRAEQLRVGPAW